MYQIAVTYGEQAVIELTTEYRKLARAMKELATENGYECTVVVQEERTVKFKGIE